MHSAGRVRWRTRGELPDVMRAVVLTGHGDFDCLEFRDDCPLPRPQAGQVLVRVGACGLNNTDVNTRTGWYSAGADAAGAAWSGRDVALPRIQGADVSGTVAGVASGVAPALLGRRVLVDPWLRDWNDPQDLARCGYLGSECDGGFADYMAVDRRNVHAIDSALSDAGLATFPTAWATAENMLRRAAVAAGDRVLVTGSSGGVGTALLQLARRRGAQTIALSAPAKARLVEAAGADHVLPRAPRDLRAALAGATGRDDVTVVADVVGGPLWPQLLEVLVRGGRYVCAGAIAGPQVRLDLRSFYLRDLTLLGATVVRPGVFAALVGYIERGEVRPMLAETYPLDRLVAAQQAFLAKRHVGTVVIAVRTGS